MQVLRSLSRQLLIVWAYNMIVTIVELSMGNWLYVLRVYVHQVHIPLDGHAVHKWCNKLIFTHISMKKIFLYSLIVFLSSCALFEKKEEEYQSGSANPILSDDIEVQIGSPNR